MRTCIVCGSLDLLILFDPGQQPLTTLGVPKTAKEALNLPRFGMCHVLCEDCGHIFNLGFDPGVVDYTQDWQMYNTGKAWQESMKNSVDLVDYALSMEPVDTVLEIGSGDGAFLRRLRDRWGLSRRVTYIGIDPGVDLDKAKIANCHSTISIRRVFFDCHRDIPQVMPDLIVMRHVLEHFPEPWQFMERLAQACQACGIAPYMFVEVPNGELILERLRLQDMLYEHVSHFTESSLNRLLGRHFETIRWETNYFGGVIAALVKLRSPTSHACMVHEFKKQVKSQASVVQDQLDVFRAGSKPLAFWGAIGKSASFFNLYGLDKDRYPLVVDSNPDIVGRYVPGTGQEIQSPEELLENPPGVIVVTSSWRVMDIAIQIQEFGIEYDQIMYLDDGQLIQYEVN